MGKWQSANKCPSSTTPVKSNKKPIDIFKFNFLPTHLQGVEEADKFSKEALLLPPGLMMIKDYENNLLVNQYVRLWMENSCYEMHQFSAKINDDVRNIWQPILSLVQDGYKKLVT